jgi:hypothetical protein
MNQQEEIIDLSKLSPRDYNIYTSNLTCVCMDATNEKLEELLLEKNVSINDWFIASCHQYTLEATIFFVNYGADINYKNGKALQYAIYDDNQKLIDFLIEHGIDYTAENIIETCLKDGHLYTLERILEAGIDPNTICTMALKTVTNINYLLTVLHLLRKYDADVNQVLDLIKKN